MYSKDERIRIFRHESNLYYSYLHKIRTTEESLQVLVNWMNNIHSPELNDVRTEPKRIKEDRMIKFLEAKDVLEDRLAELNRMVSWIRKVIDNIPFTGYRLIIWQSYVEKIPLNTLSATYELSPKILGKNRKNALLHALTDRMMYEHDAIEVSLSRAMKRKLSYKLEEQ